MKKVVGIGETVFDIVFRGGTPQAGVPGGSTFNAMISLGRTIKNNDVSLKMVSQIGRDQLASIVLDFMRNNNVDTDAMKCIEGCQSTLSVAVLDENYNAQYEFFRDASMPHFSADEIEFEEGDILIFGSFFAISPGTCEETQRMVEKAHNAGAIIYYDINFRTSHLSELSRVRPLIEKNCSMSDIVRGSIEDVRYVFGANSADEAYNSYISKICPTFICTKGGDNVEVFSKVGKAEFPVPQVETVSTIGAGDNFNAGIVYGFIKEQINRKQICCITPEEWGRLVPVATLFSANVCASMFNYVDIDFAEKKLLKNQS